MAGRDPGTTAATRREALRASGVALGSLVAGPAFARAAECVLTSRQVDGPYYIGGAPGRRDLRSGKPGTDFLLRMKVIDAATCEAIAGVRTEIWSCDALGNYSGHPDVDPDVPPRFGRAGAREGGGPRGGTAGRRPGPPFGGSGAGGSGRSREPTGPKRFLRGAQTADDEGEVEFLTIYPGWYAPRAVHVHVKVHLGGNELLTTQLYFPDDLTDEIHQREAYAARYPTPHTNAKDQVKYWGLDGNEPLGVYPTMTVEGATQVGTLTIGVRKT